MENEEHEWFDEHQEEICEYCETTHILGCKSSTSTFQCEGSRCDEAYTAYRESFENNSEDWHDDAQVLPDKTDSKQQMATDELKAIINDILNDKI